MSEPRTNCDGLTFQDWLRRLDSYLAGKVGLTHHDLADTDMYSAWDDCGSPEDHGSDMLYDEGLGEDDYDD